LQDQLFDQVRHLIVSGNLKPNTRVIATRFLAEQTGVSRTTVLLVYERLISEGYLKTQPTVGTFVCDVLPDAPVRKRLQNSVEDKGAVRHAQAHPGIFVPSPVAPAEPPLQMDFCRFLPDASLLPSKAWLRSTQSILERQAQEAADSVPIQGLKVLRQVLADWLAARRGMAVAPEQIIIVSGLRQAYAIISHLFQRRGDRVVVESPGNPDLIQFLVRRGASIIPVPVDHHGLMTEHLSDESPVSLVCVSPARESPVGGTLSLSRRQRLIDWARKTGAYIIENDIDSDLRYLGSPPLPLIAMDSSGLVFHIGSFSQTLGAGLCLGYIIAPTEFVGAASAIKAMSDDGCSWIEQRVLADFIGAGAYDHHLRRLRRTLMARRDCLIRALEANFGSVRLAGVEAGAQLTWLLPPDFPSAQKIKELARTRGLDVYAVLEEPICGQSPDIYGNRALVLSYAAMGERQIKEGIARLAGVIENIRSDIHSSVA
jgi:GntR family transcriptional regulator/MocR family aminotransferase